MSAWLVRIAAVCLVLGVTSGAGYSQNRKPTAQEVAAIRNCASRYETNAPEAERQCLFNLVATPCLNTPHGSANLGAADCYRIEAVIWDDLLNDNYQSLLANLDDRQTAKLRDMQRAWIVYRDTTCGFYDVKIQGSMAVPMQAACAARETARRALLLKVFIGL